MDENININEKADIEIVGIRFKKKVKIYYFDPDGLKIDEGQSVIVETARGIEYGNTVISNRMVKYEEVIMPFRKVIRIATEEDEIHNSDNTQKEKQAFDIFLEKIADHRLEMKLVDVEYIFDNSKLLFFFTADGRIDFRDLVKDLAAIFRTRIELRQIASRDEAKLIGGLGVCGRAFCCKTFMNDFVPVSIKMAKDQSLSLNSSKISGTCGKLMCCLRYEYDFYEEELRNMPQVDAIVETPDGDGIVMELNVFAGLIKVRSQKNPELPPKMYDKKDIKRIKGYIRKERSDDNIDEDLKILEKEK
jgi:Uncharacterized homolog of PSP1